MESYESLTASGLTRVQPTPIVNGRVPPPSAPSMGRTLVGTIPLEMQLDADFAENQYGGQVPSYRLMPPASSGQAAVNSAAQSTQIVIQQSSGSGVLLETNGIKNASQSVLNLQGTAVVGSDAAGNVTINGGGGGDGLIHGDSIWDIDPAYVPEREDFRSFVNGTIVGLSTNIGDYGNWSLKGIVSDQTQMIGAPPHLGQFGWYTTTTASQGGMLMHTNMNSITGYAGWALMEYPSWKGIWIFQYNGFCPNNGLAAEIGSTVSLAKKSSYIGLTGDMPFLAVQDGRPYCFCGVRYDTDTTSPSIADTTFHFECVANAQSGSYTRNNTQGNTIDSGITPTMGVWYRLEIECTAAGSVTMSLYGDDGSSSTGNVLAMPSYTFTSTSASGSVVDGVARVNITETVTPYVYGSVLTVTAPSGFGGTWISAGFTASSGQQGIWYAPSLAGKSFSSSSASITGYAGMIPFFSLANDSESSPATCAIFADFFAFVWNPGVGGGTATPNPLKSRYF